MDTISPTHHSTTSGRITRRITDPFDDRKANRREDNDCHQKCEINTQLRQHIRRRDVSAVARRLPPKSLLSRLKSIGKSADTKAYVCRQIGCHKVLFNKRWFASHKRWHQSDQRIRWQNANPLIPTDSEPNDGQTSDNPSADELVSSDRSTPGVGKRVAKSAKPLVSGMGFQSFAGVKDKVVLKVFEGIKRYICKYCRYETYGKTGHHRMAVHINGQHLRSFVYRCDVSGCRRFYFNPNTFRIHKMNHLCGYGMKDTAKPDAVCGNHSINRFRTNVVIDGKKYYKCIFSADCQYTTSHHNAIKSHIHSHVCPFRLKSVRRGHQLCPNTVDIMKEFNRFGKTVRKKGQKFYECRRMDCKFISSTIQGLTAHIKRKHYSTDDKSFASVADVLSANHSDDNNGNSAATGRVVHIDLDEETNQSWDLTGDCGESVPIQPKRPFECFSEGYGSDEDVDFYTAEESRRTRKRFKRFHKMHEWLPFKCSYCESSFDDLVLLRKHRLSHQ